MAALATTVFLVRHAAHDRVDRILAGRMPAVRLGDAGHVQAARLADRLAGEKLAAVFSSPLERCRETARPIAAAQGCSVDIAGELNEIDCGEWTGRSFVDLREDPRWQRWNSERATASAPDGEAMSAVQERALSAVEGWVGLYPGAAVAAVTHGDVVKAVVCGVLGLSLDRYHAFEIEPASVTTLVMWAGGGKVVGLNECTAPRSAP